MIIGPGTVPMGFVAAQGAILYEAYRHKSPEREQQLPSYLRMMAEPLGDIAHGDAGEISPLFALARADLEAVREGRQWMPRPQELGTPELAAYETAQAFSKVAITAIEAVLLYGPHDSPPKPEAVVSSLMNMSLNFRLAEGMYHGLSDQSQHFPLREVREYAFDQHDCAIRKLLRGELARQQAEFPSSLEISLEVQEAAARRGH